MAKGKGIKQKQGRRKQSWQAQELSDINKYWQRPWGSKEGKRQAAKRST